MQSLVEEEAAERCEEKPLTKVRIFCLGVLVFVYRHSPLLGLTGYSLMKIIYVSLHIEECPTFPILPITVLVSGCIHLLVGTVVGLMRHRTKVKVDTNADNKTEEEKKAECEQRFTTLSLFLLMLLWLIIESPFVLISHNNQSTTLESSGTRCSHAILQFAFVTIIIDWLFISIGCVGVRRNS